MVRQVYVYLKIIIEKKKKLENFGKAIDDFGVLPGAILLFHSQFMIFRGERALYQPLSLKVQGQITEKDSYTESAEKDEGKVK